MILPEKRYGFSSRTRKKGFKRVVFLLSLAGLFAVAYFYIQNRESLKNFIDRPSRNEILMEMWDSQKYSDLIVLCDSILGKNPSDFEALMFRGFASFYEGVSRVNLEEKLPHMDDSVSYLRKAVIFDNTRFRPQIDYILGKAYYHKGKYYSDLAVKYLERSLAGNYEGKDIFEYLGLAYSELGEKEKSLHYFEKAVEHNQSDILFYILAQVYMELGNLAKAEENLLRSNNMTSDWQIEEKNLFLLGQIYESRQDMIKAEECYLRIVEKNPRSADAYYKLGLLYETAGDRIKARAEWRKALRADPEHYGTRLKLF